MKALIIVEVSPGNFYISPGQPPGNFTVQPGVDLVAIELGENTYCPAKTVLAQVKAFFSTPETPPPGNP